MDARIAPVEAPFSPETQAAFDQIMPPGVPPLTLFRILARSERIYRRFRDGGLLDKGGISLREREIMIDRTCARCGNEYEWGVHVALFAERAALDSAEIEALAVQGLDWPLWSPSDRAIIGLADSLHNTAQIDEPTWYNLKRHYSDEQILELIALAGFYRTVSYYCNGLKLPAEPYGVPLPRP